MMARILITFANATKQQTPESGSPPSSRTPTTQGESSVQQGSSQTSQSAEQVRKDSVTGENGGVLNEKNGVEKGEALIIMAVRVLLRRIIRRNAREIILRKFRVLHQRNQSKNTSFLIGLPFFSFGLQLIFYNSQQFLNRLSATTNHSRQNARLQRKIKEMMQDLRSL